MLNKFFFCPRKRCGLCFVIYSLHIWQKHNRRTHSQNYLSIPKSIVLPFSLFAHDECVAVIITFFSLLSCGFVLLCECCSIVRTFPVSTHAHLSGHSQCIRLQLHDKPIQRFCLFTLYAVRMSSSFKYTIRIKYRTTDNRLFSTVS